MKKVLILFSVWNSILLPIHLLGQEKDKAVLIIQGMHKNDLDQMPNLSIIEYGIVNNRVNETVTPEIQETKAIYRFLNLKDDKFFQVPRNVNLDLSTVPFYFISSGDSINVLIDSNKIAFSGKGHEKFEIFYALYKISQERKENEDNTIRGQINKNLEILDLQEKYLNKQRYTISENRFFTILNEIRLYNQILNYGILNRKSGGKESNIYEYYQLQKRDSAIINDILAHSYAAYFIEKCKYEEFKLRNQKFSFENAFRYIDLNSTGINKESLLTYLIYRQLRSSSISSDQLLVLNSFENDTLKGYIDILTKGRIDAAEAPSFSLTGIDGKEYSSKMFSGKILVLDFWFTGCGACQAIPPILGPIAEKYKDRDDVVFLSISIDKDMDIWKQSIKKEKYTFKHSIKLYTGGKGRSHPVMNDYTVNGCPTILLISKSGKILSIPESVRNDNGRSLENQINYELSKESS